MQVFEQGNLLYLFWDNSNFSYNNAINNLQIILGFIFGGNLISWLILNTHSQYAYIVSLQTSVIQYPRKFYRLHSLAQRLLDNRTPHM